MPQQEQVTLWNFMAEKHKRLQREGDISSGEQKVLSFLSFGEREGMANRLLPRSCAGLSPVGQLAPSPAGGFLSARSKQELGELSAQPGDSQHHLLCHSSWKELP